MARFVPKGKLSKKAQKELNRQRRVTWEFSPVTKTVESRKRYNRKKNSYDRHEDYGIGVFHLPCLFQPIQGRIEEPRRKRCKAHCFRYSALVHLFFGIRIKKCSSSLSAWSPCHHMMSPHFRHFILFAPIIFSSIYFTMGITFATQRKIPVSKIRSANRLPVQMNHQAVWDGLFLIFRPKNNFAASHMLTDF